MRRALSVAAIAAFATFAIGGFATPASAICGGGEPGEACYCPELKLVKIYC